MDAKELGNQPAYPNPTNFTQSGLTKREAAAIAAMQGLLSTEPNTAFYDPDTQRPAQTMDENYRLCAQCSVGYADALLAELAKTEG